jgi:hypothetical protein
LQNRHVVGKRLHSCGAGVAVLFLASALAGCGRGGVVERASAAEAVPGRVSGFVRGAAAAAPVARRTVEAINLETGERLLAWTSREGNFSFTLRPGRYRVRVSLRAGEAVVDQPDVVSVAPAALHRTADIVIGSVRGSRPRVPASRVDSALGPPLA